MEKQILLASVHRYLRKVSSVNSRQFVCLFVYVSGVLAVV